jgi:hypothetical protein
MKITCIAATLLTSLCCISGLSHADGLSDLKNALAKEQGKSAIKANFEIKTWSKQGEDKSMEEKSGFATITIEDDAHGLQLLFSRDLLNTLEAEQRAKEKDHQAKTPASDAANDINTKAIQEMTSAASSVLALLEKGEIKSERADAFNGKPARIINVVFSQDKLSPKEREHLKKYEGNAEIWIADDGTPLAYRSHEVITASFLMLVSFDIVNDESGIFALHGDRLISTHQESKGKGSGLGQKGENVTIKNLQIQ